MFDYIKIEGFRSFKHVELEMPRLAVLIGPNGGGKSNFIELLMLMAKAGQGQLANGVFGHGGFRSIAFGFDASREVSVELRFKPDVRLKIAMRSFGDNGFQISDERLWKESPTEPSKPVNLVTRDAAGATFEQSGGDLERKTNLRSAELAIFQVKDPANYEEAAHVCGELQEWVSYRDIDVGPKSPLRYPALARPDIRLLADGGNLSSVLHSIQQGHPQEWDDILEILGTAYPPFSNITIPAGGGDGRFLLRWFERPYEKEGLSANLLSDGTLKLLCLIAILKSPDPPPLICIDEPELGLHPDWIELVAELMQDCAEQTQVIAATHSPQLVAKLDPDQVIVTEKHEGETTMNRLSAKDLEKWLRDFNLADLWLSGHIGGRP